MAARNATTHRGSVSASPIQIKDDASEKLSRTHLRLAHKKRFRPFRISCQIESYPNLYRQRRGACDLFAVSGGGIEFMPAFAEKTYGIPPEQVVGSSGKTKFELRHSKPVLVKLPEINFIDDKTGKPVGINEHIGQLDKRLDEADAKGWTVVSMKDDWKTHLSAEREIAPPMKLNIP
jgi:hypothetical protein